VHLEAVEEVPPRIKLEALHLQEQHPGVAVQQQQGTQVSAETAMDLEILVRVPLA